MSDNRVIINEEYMVNIASAIRERFGTTDTYTPVEMSQAILDLQINMQSKTVTPTTSTQIVKPDDGYSGLSEVTVSAMPTAEQATPSITVSSDGLITAVATQSAGYVSSGTTSATKKLVTQASKSITPTTSSQVAVASGVYTTGAITVAGDANLLPKNIADGVSIFGIAGEHVGGSYTVHIGTTAPTSDFGSDGDIYIVRGDAT